MMEMCCSVYDVYGLRARCKVKPNIELLIEISTAFVRK